MTQPNNALTKIVSNAGKLRTEKQQSAIQKRRVTSLAETLGCLEEAHDPAKGYFHSGIGAHGLSIHLAKELGFVVSMKANATKEAELHEPTALWLTAVTPQIEAIEAMKDRPLAQTLEFKGWPPPLRSIRHFGKAQAPLILRRFSLTATCDRSAAQVGAC